MGKQPLKASLYCEKTTTAQLVNHHPPLVLKVRGSEKAQKKRLGEGGPLLKAMNAITALTLYCL